MNKLQCLLRYVLTFVFSLSSLLVAVGQSANCPELDLVELEMCTPTAEDVAGALQEPEAVLNGVATTGTLMTSRLEKFYQTSNTTEYTAYWSFASASGKVLATGCPQKFKVVDKEAPVCGTSEITVKGYKDNLLSNTISHEYLIESVANQEITWSDNCTVSDEIAVQYLLNEAAKAKYSDGTVVHFTIKLKDKNDNESTCIQTVNIVVNDHKSCPKIKSSVVEGACTVSCGDLTSQLKANVNPPVMDYRSDIAINPKREGDKAENPVLIYSQKNGDSEMLTSCTGTDYQPGDYIFYCRYIRDKIGIHVDSFCPFKVTVKNTVTPEPPNCPNFDETLTFDDCVAPKDGIEAGIKAAILAESEQLDKCLTNDKLTIVYTGGDLTKPGRVPYSISNFSMQRTCYANVKTKMTGIKCPSSVKTFEKTDAYTISETEIAEGINNFVTGYGTVLGECIANSELSTSYTHGDVCVSGSVPYTITYGNLATTCSASVVLPKPVANINYCSSTRVVSVSVTNGYDAYYVGFANSETPVLNAGTSNAFSFMLPADKEIDDVLVYGGKCNGKVPCTVNSSQYEVKAIFSADETGAVNTFKLTDVSDHTVANGAAKSLKWYAFPVSQTEKPTPVLFVDGNKLDKDNESTFNLEVESCGQWVAMVFENQGCCSDTAYQFLQPTPLCSSAPTFSSQMHLTSGADCKGTALETPAFVACDVKWKNKSGSYVSPSLSTEAVYEAGDVVEWLLTNGTKTATCKATIVIDDNRAPDCIADLSIVLDGCTKTKDEVLAAIQTEVEKASRLDNCSLNSELTVTLNGTDVSASVRNYNFTYTLKDKANQTSAACPVAVSICDKTVPTLASGKAWPSNITGQDNSKDNADDADLLSADDVAKLYSDCSTVSAEIASQTIVGNDDAWTITRTYTVSDACGNVVNPSPTMSVSGASPALDIKCSEFGFMPTVADGVAKEAVYVNLPTISGSTSGLTWTIVSTDNGTAAIVGNQIKVSSLPLGKSYVEVRATRGGKSATCKQRILIVKQVDACK